jgi:hypothetical protein
VLCFLIMAVLALPAYLGGGWLVGLLLARLVQPVAAPPPLAPELSGEALVWRVPQTTPAQVQRAVTALVFLVSAGGLVAMVAMVAYDASLGAAVGAASVGAAGALGLGLWAIVAWGRRRWIVVEADATHVVLDGVGSKPLGLPWDRLHGVRVEVDGLRIEADAPVWIPAEAVPPEHIAAAGEALDRLRRSR